MQITAKTSLNSFFQGSLSSVNHVLTKPNHLLKSHFANNSTKVSQQQPLLTKVIE